MSCLQLNNYFFLKALFHAIFMVFFPRAASRTFHCTPPLTSQTKLANKMWYTILSPMHPFVHVDSLEHIHACHSEYNI